MDAANTGDALLETPAHISTRRLVLRLGGVRLALWGSLTLVAFVAVLPSAYLLLWALAGTDTVGILESSPSLAWFHRILGDPQWLKSLLYSTTLALLASGLGTAILTTHFYFMRYVQPIWDRISYASVFLVTTIPATIYALSLRLVGGQMGLPEIILVAIGHLVLVMPAQFFVLESGQERVPSERLFAGSTLGATHSRNILFCYLPLMRQAISAAFLVGLFFSLDELVIATFVIDSSLVTVPRRLWDQVNRGMTPAPAVMACVFGILYLTAFAVLAYLVRLRSRREGFGP